jgi:hypothetical protein
MSIPGTTGHGDTFWLVFNPAGLGAPKYAHGTEESARAEAERLAGLNPGACFHVMKSQASVKQQVFDWSDLK